MPCARIECDRRARALEEVLGLLRAIAEYGESEPVACELAKLGLMNVGLIADGHEALDQKQCLAWLKLSDPELKQ
jgi:hypothetical protein